jgi:hypothetical protein
MSTWWAAIAAVLGTIITAVAANMVSEEVAGRLDLIPRAFIYFAGRRAPRDLRAELNDEWLAELGVILKNARPLPVTRLLVGMRYALGLLHSAPAIARELNGLPQRPRQRIDPVQVATIGACGLASVALFEVSGRFTAVTALPVLFMPALTAIRYALARGSEQQAIGDAVIAVVCQALEARDYYTLDHCQRVSAGAVVLGEELGIRADRIEALRCAGMMHDVGKLGVPAQLLRKTGPLSEDEYAAIQLHVFRGLEIVRNMDVPGEALAAIMHHHERVDGRGYPMGLAGDEIPELARIVAVVDAFDSMAHSRSHREGRLVEEAATELHGGAGTMFDPAMVDAFIRVLERKGWLPLPQSHGGEAVPW